MITKTRYKYQFDKLNFILEKMLYLGISNDEITKAVNDFLTEKSKEKHMVLNDLMPDINIINSNIPFEKLKRKSINISKKSETKRGRKAGFSLEKQKVARAALELHKTNMSIVDICAALEIKSKATLYKYIRWAQSNNQKI